MQVCLKTALLASFRSFNAEDEQKQNRDKKVQE